MQKDNSDKILTQKGGCFWDIEPFDDLPSISYYSIEENYLEVQGEYQVPFVAHVVHVA